MNSGIIAALADSAIPFTIGVFLLIGRRRIVSQIKDPKKRIKTERILGFSAPLVMLGGLVTFFTQLPSTEDSAAVLARQLNEAGPRMVDRITRFDRAVAGPGDRLLIEQTVSITADRLPQEKWNALVPELRRKLEPSYSQAYARKGITVVYRYHDVGGLPLGEIVFTPQTK